MFLSSQYFEMNIQILNVFTFLVVTIVLKCLLVEVTVVLTFVTIQFVRTTILIVTYINY